MPAYATTREQDLFCECLDRPAADRDSWLDSACSGDPQLKLRIQRLLAAHDSAELACVDTPPLPEFIDRYRIVRIVGEGGMGVVYEALEEEPLRRRVALKAIRPGMDTQSVLARFRIEQQALAAMEHPHIAKVFDAGNTSLGRPYFVMEYVDGSPLLRYCAENGLSLRQKVEVFISICHAVQHAHQKGVIHRDLKPGNILVSGIPDAACPKIIDFGIARAITPAIDLHVTQTNIGFGVGTPAYMSPEQAGYAGLDVDTRSDVYSLGVILYELLTGTLPASPGPSGAVEFLRQLATGNLDIAPPSSRQQGIASDLNAVVSKALDIDRERRYETALALAADLRRFLDGHPVTACAPTVAYRARKFWARNRVQVTAACFAALALIGGVVAGGYGLLQARKAEAAARQDAANARHISDFLGRLFMLSDPNRGPNSAMSVRQVLDEGTKRVQSEMAAMPKAQADLLSTLGHVYESLGSYHTARSLVEKSLTLKTGEEDEVTAKALVTLARSAQRLSDLKTARQAAARAVAIRSRNAGEDTYELSEALNLLGGIEGQLENFSEAEAAHRRALAIQERIKGPDHIATYNSWRGLGMIFDRQGKHAEALRCFQRVVPIARRHYGSEHTVVADALHNVAMSSEELGKFEQAEATYLDVLALRRKLLGPDHPSIAFTAAGLGHVYRKQGRFRDAAPYFEESVRIREKALGPNNLRTWETRKNLGLVKMALGELDGGYTMLSNAIVQMEKAYGARRNSVLAAHRDAGMALVKAKRYAQAVHHLIRVAGADTPSNLRVDLQSDPSLEGLRRSGAMKQLSASR